MVYVVLYSDFINATVKSSHILGPGIMILLVGRF